VLIDERVRTALAASTRFGDLEHLAVTDSTNRVVAERAGAGAPEGLVVVADLQTAGRGRLDRSWEAEPGAALLVSVLLRPSDLPTDRWHLLTAGAGLAARQACSEVGGFTPDLKWPNDLMVGDRKLAGILAEATAGSAGGAVVVGMGLNVHGGPPGAAWVDEAAGTRVGRTGLLVAWLTALDGHLGRWDALAGAYRQTCSTVGRRVVIDQGGDRLVGRAERIDDEGRLVVRPDGTAAARTVAAGTVAVSAGDVTHVRPAEGAW